MAIALQPRHLVFLLVAFAVLAAWVCFHHQPLGCRYCDTRGYLFMGSAYAEAGGITEVIMTNEQTGEPFEASKLRLYGYPLFVAGLVKVSGIAGIDQATVIFAAQLAVYLAGCLWLAALVRRRFSPGLGLLVLGALLLNPLVYPYFGTPLSDSLSAGLDVILAGVLTSLFIVSEGPGKTWKSLAHGLLIGLLLGYAIMVRPGNLYLTPFACLTILAIAWLHRAPALLAIVIPVALGFAVAVAPQLAFNWQHYQQFTFMPVSELGKFQLDTGRTLLKYATWTDKGGRGIVYPSPWPTGMETGIAWYVQHPLRGLKTVVMHVFGMLDFDYYFPYVDKVKPRHEFLLFLMSQALVFWGIWGWFRALCRWNTLRTTSQGDARPLAFALFAAAAFIVSWLAIYALAAGENRFALPVLILAAPWAVWGFARPVDWRQQVAGGGFVVYLLCAHHVAGLLDGLRAVPGGG